MAFIAGAFTATLGGNTVGQIQDGFTVEWFSHGQLITGDNFGRTPQDLVNQGLEVFLEATLMEFDALVIALLGGVAIAGGFGSVVGMFFGAIILAVVTSAATGMILSPDWQFILKAIAVFLAIVTQTWALARRNR